MSALPPDDRDYFESRGIRFDVIDGQGQRGVVLCEWSLGNEGFDVEYADVLIVLPAGYPDIAPDMFHTDPWIKLKGAGRFPTRAEHPFDFGGRRWQRWSRHNREWRPGIDGIWTMVRRVERALQEAA